MDNEFLLNLKEISIEVILIAILVFGLTMLIKWPIKKYTSRFDENKRKAINTIIVFIPMILAYFFSVLYDGIFNLKWFDVSTLDKAASVYILAVGFYAIYSRIVILIKGKKTSEESSNLSSETVKYIKTNIKTISKNLKIDEKKLFSVINKIEKLLMLREELLNNENFQDISATENLDNQIRDLNCEKLQLESSISKANEEVYIYQNSLKKGNG